MVTDMRLKRVMLIATVMVMVGAFTGCGKKEEKQEQPKKVEKEKEPEEPEVKKTIGEAVEEPEIPVNQNLLTGLGDLSEEAIGKRPVAVMVNNVQKAMPQYGIGQADLIFEIPVEGDVTRFMALYGDYTKVPKICPIRSCRYYFPAISQGFDAFYVNWGIDETVSDYLKSLNMDQIEGITNTGGLFGRDQDKRNQGYALEHTGYFDGTQFASYIETKGLRTDLKEDKKEPAFSFNGMEEQIKPASSDCTSIQINFGSQSATFTYDAEKMQYLKQINGNPQIDAVTGEQLGFTNVFVLETEISIRDDVGHKNLDWDGSTDAKGYYFSNGGMQPITWSKEEGNEDSYLTFYDETGNVLKINRGKSYIAFNYKDKVTFQ